MSWIPTLLLTLGAAALAPCDDTSPEADAVRSAREAFNAAIASQDPAAIAAVLDDDVILVTGTDSDVYRGREAQVDLWRGDFSAEVSTRYVRTPACVRPSPLLPMALESGTWRGTREASDDFAAGSYTAKWRLGPNGWRLEAELFMTEACGGSFCP